MLHANEETHFLKMKSWQTTFLNEFIWNFAKSVNVVIVLNALLGWIIFTELSVDLISSLTYTHMLQPFSVSVLVYWLNVCLLKQSIISFYAYFEKLKQVQANCILKHELFDFYLDDQKCSK